MNENLKARIDKEIRSEDIKHRDRLTNEQIASISNHLAYEWIKIGKWKKRDFEKWLSVKLEIKMSNNFKREDRYYVFKISDIEATGMTDIFPLLDTVKMITDLNRESRNKKKLECVVVESDWPEFEPVWKSIENRTSRNAESENVAFAWRRKGSDDEWKVCFDLKQIPDNGIIDKLDTEFRFMRWSDLKV